MVEVRIRTAVAADEPALSDVLRRASLSNDGDRATLLTYPDALTFSPPSAGEGRVRVAVVAEQVVGFATVVVTGRVGELDDLFVEPAWMQRGIGRALVLDAVAGARGAGLTRIEVTANDHALPFYAKAGFVLDGVTETRFGPATRMHLDVP